MGTSPSTGRPVRHSRGEIRELMLEAGLALLAEEGLGIGAGDITFKRVFDRVAADTGTRLTNASVIRRVWENQAEFQDELLSTVALAGDGGGDRGETATALGPVLAAVDRSTPAGRLAGLTQACRVGGEASLRALNDSRNWSLWVGVWVLAVTGPTSGRGRSIREALLDGYESTTEAWTGMHGALADHLGLRLREPLTLRQFTVSVGALVEGCALREGADPGAGVVERPTGPGGAPEAWTLFGIGLEALARQYFEIDPDWSPPGTGG